MSLNRQSLEKMNFSHKKRKIPIEITVQHHEETGGTDTAWVYRRAVASLNTLKVPWKVWCYFKDGGQTKDAPSQEFSVRTFSSSQ